MRARKQSGRRALSEERIRVAVPVALAAQLQAIADGDASTISTTARRLLSRMVSVEFAHLQQLEAAAREAGRQAAL